MLSKLALTCISICSKRRFKLLNLGSNFQTQSFFIMVFESSMASLAQKVYLFVASTTFSLFNNPSMAETMIKAILCYEEIFGDNSLIKPSKILCSFVDAINENLFGSKGTEKNFHRFDYEIPEIKTFSEHCSRFAEIFY
ncbi:MAG: hypothetical protein C4B58_15340 [Deltaproteobacteria bacterium]|nr:MAG: hypothetical protein C4B58_15340 [Deltaproteobacteria bacterium]